MFPAASHSNDVVWRLTLEVEKYESYSILFVLAQHINSSRGSLNVTIHKTFITFSIFFTWIFNPYTGRNSRKWPRYLNEIVKFYGSIQIPFYTRRLRWFKLNWRSVYSTMFRHFPIDIFLWEEASRLAPFIKCYEDATFLTTHRARKKNHSSTVIELKVSRMIVSSFTGTCTWVA